MPAMKTTGNSRPLALCSVISVISSPLSTIGVEVGVQRDLLQEALERRLVGALVVLGGDADELLEVLEPALGLQRALRAQRRLVAALVQHAAHDVSATGRPARPACRPSMSARTRSRPRDRARP